MLEVFIVLKQMAELGVTMPAAIAIGFLWKINQNFTEHDRRISILEAFHYHRKKD